MSPVKIVNIVMGTVKENDSFTTTDEFLPESPLIYTQMETAMIKDTQLKEAAEQAEREGSERPLVMQQLRTKIQLDRLRHGKGELTVSFEEPQKYELTPEEKEKQEKRKTRNREAAKKSRIKKKNLHSDLQKQNKKLREKNAFLRAELHKLYDTVSNLQEGVQNVRHCGHSPTPYPMLPVKPGSSPPQQTLRGQQDPVPPLFGPVIGRPRSSASITSLPFSRGQHFIIKDNQLIPVHHGFAGACSSTRLVIPSLSLGGTLRQGDPPHTVTRGGPEEPVIEMMEESLTPEVRVSPHPKVGSEFWVPDRSPDQTIDTDDLVADLVSTEVVPAGPAPQQFQPGMAYADQVTSFLRLLEGKEGGGWGQEEEEEEEDDVLITAVDKPGTPLFAASSAGQFQQPFLSLDSLSSSSPPSSTPSLGSTMQILTRGS